MQQATFCTECLEVCEKHTTGGGDAEADPTVVAAQKAVYSVMAMLYRMQSIVYAKVVVYLGEKKLKGKDLKSLPKLLQSMSSVLEIDWAAEVQTLENNKGGKDAVNLFMGKLEMFESAFSATEATLLKEPTFSEKQQTCKTFCLKFVELVSMFLDGEFASMTTSLKFFADKFGDLQRCCEDDMNMGPFEWAFKEGAQSELKKEIDAFRDVHKDGHAFVEGLAQLMQHSSPAAILQDLIKTVDSQTKAFKDLLKDAGKVCTLVIFVDLAHVATCDAKEIDKVDKHTRKHFGFGKDFLPARLIQDLDELATTAAEKSKKSTKKRDGQKSEKAEEAPAKKMKRESKKNDDKRDKPKSSRNDDGPKAKKAKKGK